MKNRENISFTDLDHNIQKFHHDVDDFSPENYEILKKQLENIKDDIWLILLESEDRYQDRIKRRPRLNKKIKEENKAGPIKAIEEYIGTNTKEFIERLQQKWVHFDDKGNMLLKRTKKAHQIANVVPVQFTPRPIITSDNYKYIRETLEAQEKKVIGELTNTLETANTKAKNIFESYTTPDKLFEKLGISVRKVDYAFFATQDQGKQKLPRKGGTHDIGQDEIIHEPPTFKKIGFLMKYLLDNKIPFRANNIIEDKNQWYQFYLYEHDITILLSDMIMGNGFRDSTYVIKWLVSWLRNVNKEELKHQQGKKIVFNENRPRRIESVFTDDPQNRPVIGEEKEDQNENNKTLITDRTTLITIIKENFTPENLTTATYRKFAKTYNEMQGNNLLLNDTIYGNVSLLGLWGKRTIEDIKKAIFEFTKPKLEIAKDSYLSNEHTKQRLLDIQACEWFDAEKMLWSTSYGNRVMELLRKACKEEYVDAVKNKSRREKKEKIEEYTGIKNLPLFALTLSSMLWWRVRCTDADYQKMLRKKFMMNIHKQSESQEYKELQKEILVYETTWEDESLHPNINKSEKRSKKRETNPEEEISKKVKEKNEIKTTKVSEDMSKTTNEIKEKTQSALVKDVLKDPITMETFPLYKVKSAKIIGETQTYRIMKAYNCPVELRLHKLSVGNNTFTIGEKIEVFGIKKSFRDEYISVNYEREKWYYKVVEFRHSHPDELADSFIPGEEYQWVVNNIQRNFVYVSLTKTYSWRIPLFTDEQYKIGDIVNVVFEGIDTDPWNKKIIKIH